MHAEIRKIHVIEQVLKIKNDAVLKELEKILKKYTPGKAEIKRKPSIYDFVGVLSKKEAAEMKKAIDETCETIDENDWK